MKKKWIMLKYDFENGVESQIGIYLLIMVVVWICCSGNYHYGELLIEYREGRTMPGVFDLILYVFQGVPPFHPFTGEGFFEIPIYWMSIVILMLYTVCRYPGDDFNKNGMMRILYSGNRSFWIGGKIVWIIIQVLIDFLVIYFTCFVFGFIHGCSFQLSINQEFWGNAFPGLLYQTNETYVVSIIILPFISLLAVGFLCMFVSVVLKPAVSMFAGCMIFVASSFADSVYLIGNHTMWVRMANFAEGGLDPTSCLMFDFVIILLSCYGFSTYIHRKDLLPSDI